MVDLEQHEAEQVAQKFWGPTVVARTVKRDFHGVKYWSREFGTWTTDVSWWERLLGRTHRWVQLSFLQNRPTLTWIEALRIGEEFDKSEANYRKAVEAKAAADRAYVEKVRASLRVAP